jgi:hypothetical protein
LVKDNKEYYQGELNPIYTKGTYPAKIKLSCGYSEETYISTKWLNLNSESAAVLIKWLKEQFPSAEVD